RRDMNLRRGLLNLKTVLRALPSAQPRSVVLEAWRLERRLPRLFENHPLPELMQLLDREAAAGALHASGGAIVCYADAVSMLDYRSPLGVCLRRSLVRYVLLRRAAVPVAVHFGAKKLPSGQGGIA